MLLSCYNRPGDQVRIGSWKPGEAPKEKTTIDLYGGKSPVELPAYGISEAAHYLQVPVATLRSWVRGRGYPTSRGQQFSEPLVDLADAARCLLSFVNLVEVHVLAAIRRQHHVSLTTVRQALDYLKRKHPSSHPLADRSFETDGLDLFVQSFEQLVNISKEGQLGMRKVLEIHLRRIERDPSGLAVRLYLFTRRHPQLDVADTAEAGPQVIVVDPRVAFGRPVLSGTHIPTEVISQRFGAGESVEELADDYGRTPSEIEEAIRCEQYRHAA